jgi:coatomer subunit epsilon
MKEALQCVHVGATMEHLSIILQVYLRIDRLDLAQQQLHQMKLADEDAILTQLGGIYCNLAVGTSGAADALHSVSALLEQYGPSPLLFNIMACALMLKGSHADAEQRLQECLQEFPDSNVPDTLINMIVCSQHQQKPTQPLVAQMKQSFPSHPYCAGVDRVQAAFDREVSKYKV